MIKIKQAYWKTKDKMSLSFDHEITTMVLKHKGVYFDPSDGDFLDKIFKEYVRKFLRKKRVTLKLSVSDVFFYGENANVYLLNYIYHDLFPKKRKNLFNPIYKSDEGSMNFHLFNMMDSQVLFLIEILEKMKINFKKLSKKYMLLPFPISMECYDEDEVYGVRYEKWKDRTKE